MSVKMGCHQSRVTAMAYHRFRIGETDTLRLAKARMAITAATRERERLLREMAKLKADNARQRLALRYARLGATQVDHHVDA